MSRYVQITYKEFKSMMDDMKFEEISVPGTFERIWKFNINQTYEIRVFSSVSNTDDVTRDVGSDAIRCVVLDSTKKRILKIEKRIYRTSGALLKTRNRCRELYKYVKKNTCTCGGVLVEKESGTGHKFLGCSNFPACRKSKNIVPDQLSLNLKVKKNY